jgi:hypothetical protein
VDFGAILQGMGEIVRRPAFVEFALMVFTVVVLGILLTIRTSRFCD